MEVMYASALAGGGDRLSEVFPAASSRSFIASGKSGIHNLLPSSAATPTGESRVVHVAMAPLVTQFNVWDVWYMDESRAHRA